MSAHYVPGVDTGIRCTDCEVDLSERMDWEPTFRLDTETGETLHGRICAPCLDDIEHIRAEDTQAAYVLRPYARRATDPVLSSDVQCTMLVECFTAEVGDFTSEVEE